MRNFMYACIALAALSFTIHCWVAPAAAQAPAGEVVACSALFPQDWGSYEEVYIMTNGDVYGSSTGGYPPVFSRIGNIFGGAAVPAQRATFGQIKAKYAR